MAMKEAINNGLTAIDLSNLSSLLSSIFVNRLRARTKHLSINTPNQFPDLVSNNKLPDIEVKVAI